MSLLKIGSKVAECDQSDQTSILNFLSNSSNCCNYCQVKLLYLIQPWWLGGRARWSDNRLDTITVDRIPLKYGV